MKNETEMENALHEVFREEDRVLLAKYAAEPGVYEMLAESFRGRNRWLSILAFGYTLGFIALTVWCAVNFFRTDPDSTKSLIGWATGFTLSFLCVGFLKIWFWLDMQRHATAREIKRLELAVARIAQSKS